MGKLTLLSLGKSMKYILLTFSLQFVFLLAFYNYVYAGTYNTAILNSPDENTIVLLPFVCDNTTDGGTIEGDETGCPNPIFDPSPILNVEFPSGGSGDLEYLWMFTTDDPTSEVAVWTPISNSNSPNYDPGAITVTTYFVRCARREGCTEYLVETNFVEKKVQCCENVTDGGSIMQNQSSCGEPFNPEVLENLVYPSGGTGDLEFQWYFSNTASPFYTGNPDWVPIIGAVSESYDSGPILQTTYFIRTARRSLCTEYVGVSNMIKIELFTPIFLQIAVNEEINCHGSATGSLNLTITGGTAPFSFSWDPTSIGDTEDPVGLTEGFYSVTVTDVNGCSVSNSITLSEPPGMLLEIQSSDNICFGENDGTASVIVSGGNPPYSYAWSTGASEGGVDGLSAGNYSVVVTDSEGCTESASTTVNGSPDILIETNITNVSCDGNTGGSASVTVSGGTPPYLYSWKDASNSEIGTNSIVNDLLAGSYFIEITDANNCKKTQSVEIVTSGQLDLSINKSDALCFGGNGGSASVETEGGFPPYTYIWDDPSSQTNANATNLKAGLYSVTVSGQNGCTNSISVLINEPPTLGLILNSTVEICEVADNGTANVIAYGGTPDYTFAWNDPLNQVSDSISGLTAGIYTVTVTDANGCTLSDSVEVELAFEPFWLEVYPTNVTCNGENNGSVSVTVIGGQFPPFQYAWNDPEMQTSSVATDLMAGTYIVTVTDLLGCTFPAEAIIYEPPQIGFVPLSEYASCSQNADGKAGIETIWGGTPPYTYLWDDPDAQTDSVATGLAPGTYSLEITDVLGCKANTSIEVFSLEPMVLSPTINHASCDGQTLGSAHINVTGGTPPYTYLWNDQAGQTTSTATALAVGNYSVTVTDANGCQAITPIKIEASGDFSIIIQPSQVVVCGNAVVPFTINANEDILSLSWTASGGTFNDSSSASPTYSMNASGEYIISVSATGNNGCSGSAETTVTIHPLAAAGIEVVSGEECDGESFELSATEIDPNYTYHWTATEGILDSPDSSTTLFTGEVPSESTITLEVTNEFGCISSSEITLNTYDTIDINIILQESEICLGEAVLLTSDLVDPAFSYEWTATGGSLDTPNSSSTYFTSSDTGEFVLSLKVTDPNGCTGFNFTNIYVHPVPVFSIDTESNNTCVGGEAALSISSLPDNYTIAWTVNGGSLDNPASPNPVFTSGISGTFVVSANIVNEFGCEGFATTSITVSEAATCEATITSDYNGLAISSWGGSDGSASATASGGTPPYSFDWSNNVDGPYNTNLSAGTYTVVITDSLGCSCESSVTLINPSKLGDLAWKDINGNGLQDENEPGMPDVQVILSGMNSLGNPVNDTTVTDESGMYMFDGLHPGTYKLTFESLTEHPFTQVNTGENDQIDSDVDPDMGMTGNIELGQGEYNATIDAGYLSSSIRIGDFVWHDINKNGIQDIDEPGVADFMVKLITPGADDIFDTSDDVIIPTITDTDGKYFFDVLPGKYIIEFMPSSLPDGWDFTLMDQGDTDTNDSDADNVSGRISMFVIEDEQEDDFSFDAGIHSLCDNLTDPGIIGGDEILCAGEDPTPITNLAFPSGGSGEIEYLWMRSYIVGPFDQFTWQLIPGATEPSYDPGPLYQTTSFIRCARRVGCELFVEPTPVVKTVVPGPDQSTVSGPIELCVGEEGDYSVLIEEIGTITYDWNFGEDAEPETATIQSVTNVSWSSPGVKTVTLSINHLDCFYSYSFEVTVLDCPTILGLFGELSGIPTPTNEVALKWTMKQEPIESNFVVERANADRDKFYTIGVVTGNGGAEQSTYTYIDSKPFLGNNYYRIKHFDNSNNYMYSDEIEILMQPDGINNILMYPNPFEHTINIQIIRPLEEQATIELVDVYGKILQTIHLPMGKFNHQLDLSHLPNGMYFAYICYDGYRKLTEKILKKE